MNVSPLVDTIVNFVKPFIKEKIRNRIHIHSDMESLHKFIPKDVLPEEYGGTAGKLQVFHGELVILNKHTKRDLIQNIKTVKYHSNISCNSKII